MDTMMDDLGQALADRLRGARDARRWSLAELAEHAGVSRAMLSRIERQETSPSASTLSRIASAFGMTLAEFLSFEAAGEAARFAKSGAQPTWRDPETGYDRRQIFAAPDSALELVEIDLPPGQSAAFPASSYLGRQHVVWLLEGRLEIAEGGETYALESGDRLRFGEAGPVTYSNPGARPCRYLVAVLRG